MDREEQMLKTLERWRKVCEIDDSIPLVMINKSVSEEGKFHISMEDDLPPAMIIDGCLGAFMAVPTFQEPFKKTIANFLGATGTYSDGKLNEDDEGDLRLAVGISDGNVIVDFGKKTAWLGMPPEQALEFAKMITDKAEELINES